MAGRAAASGNAALIVTFSSIVLHCIERSPRVKLSLYLNRRAVLFASIITEQLNLQRNRGFCTNMIYPSARYQREAINRRFQVGVYYVPICRPAGGT